MSWNRVKFPYSRENRNKHRYNLCFQSHLCFPDSQSGFLCQEPVRVRHSIRMKNRQQSVRRPEMLLPQLKWSKMWQREPKFASYGCNLCYIPHGSRPHRRICWPAVVRLPLHLSMLPGNRKSIWLHSTAWACACRQIQRIRQRVSGNFRCYRRELRQSGVAGIGDSLPHSRSTVQPPSGSYKKR